MNIVSGKLNRAKRVVIYGSEGIGKTTLAAQFPDPLFIDTEGGTAHMDVRRIDRPATWSELLSIVDEVLVTPDVCKTLVIDTADWAEYLCVEHLCKQYNQKGIESFGYGKGYTYLGEEFNKFCRKLEKIKDSGRHVVITAHAKMRKFEQPDEMGAYDRWEMKLSKQVMPIVKEWADILLFLNYKTYVVTTETNTKKAQGGKRVMYANHHPCWDAKNRYGLPDEMDLDYKNIAFLFGDAEREKTPLEKLRTLISEAGVSEADVQKVVSDRGHYPAGTPIDSYKPEFIAGWVLKYWTNVLEVIKEKS